MDRGQVIQDGSLRDLLLRPANERVRAFLGRSGSELALEVLRLGHLLPDLIAALLPRPKTPVRQVRLSADLRLGQVLVAVADTDETTTVVVEGNGTAAYSAPALRQAILAELGSPMAKGNDLVRPGPGGPIAGGE
jgi:hypothetical protein